MYSFKKSDGINPYQIISKACFSKERYTKIMLIYH